MFVLKYGSVGNINLNIFIFSTILKQVFFTRLLMELKP
jgi:hypothetical protein